MQTEAVKVEHLYVHVPFCAAKCDYCAFYSEAGSAAKMDGYVEAVVRELEMFCRASASLADHQTTAGDAPALQQVEIAPTTIFFGGGTPSILPAPLMRRVLEAVGRARPPGAPPPSEWTIECNPSTVSTEKADLFREFGVNRISMGVQSLDDDLLKRIGRVHSVRAAIESFEKLRRAGFDNVNLDLIFGLPGQTIGHWQTTLRRAIELQPEHISTYCLILEEDTEFWRRYAAGAVGAQHAAPLPDDDEQLAMYELAIETLAAAGYRQYEISNFARPGRECVHNIAYWEGKDYIGLGPSACSTVGNRRWQNVPDVDEYVLAMREVGRDRRARRPDRSLVGRAGSARRSAVSFEETLTPELRAAERAAFGMRMIDGVPADWVRGRWDKQIAELLSAELVQWRGDRLRPTKRGILFADEVAAEFV